MTSGSSAFSSDDVLALDFHAARTPSAVALSAPGRKAITYGELPGCLQEIRRELADAGFGPGQVAALSLPNGPELITAFLAVSGIGACAPLNPALTEPEVRFYLSRLGARTLLVPDGVPSPAAAAARALGIQVLRIRTGADTIAGSFSLASVENAAAMPSARRTDAALLLFTSATTRLPKLVPLTWENLRSMTAREVTALRLTAADHFLCLLPLFHLYGLASVLSQLSCGGAACCTPGFHPGTFLAWLDQIRPTWFASAAPINRAVLTLARENPEVFRRSSLRMIRGVEATPHEAVAELEDAVGVPVLPSYGLTEVGGVTRITLDARKPGSVGRSTGLEIAIHDPLGNSLAAGCEGEVVVRGASVTSGYLDDTEANEAAFRGGWFHTGDLGRLDSEGFLFLTGRLKEMINRAGQKIAPPEVEEVLAAHPAVAEAAVFAVSHSTLGEDIVAAIVLREGAAASLLELRQFAATQLAAFKVPRRIVFLDRIPRTATGKPQRNELAREFQLRAERREEL